MGPFLWPPPFPLFPSSLSLLNLLALGGSVAGSGLGPTVASFLGLHKVPLMGSVHATYPGVFRLLWQLFECSWRLGLRLTLPILQVFKFPIQGSAGSLLTYVAALGSKRLGRKFGTPKRTKKYPKGKKEVITIGRD